MRVNNTRSTCGRDNRSTKGEKSEEGTVEDLNSEIKWIKKKEFENLPDSLGPLLLTVSYDMGWQKRSTGRNYDSLSGHGFYVGCISGKMVRAGVLQKTCTYCYTYQSLDLPVPDHNCMVNHDGSSDSMKFSLYRTLLEDISAYTKGKVIIGTLVTNDDSTLWSNCKSLKK